MADESFQSRSRNHVEISNHALSQRESFPLLVWCYLMITAANSGMLRNDLKPILKKNNNKQTNKLKKNHNFIKGICLETLKLGKHIQVDGLDSFLAKMVKRLCHGICRWQ